MAVFFLVKGVNFLRSRTKKEEEQKQQAPKAPDPQLELLTEIRDLLKQQAISPAQAAKTMDEWEETQDAH